MANKRKIGAIIALDGEKEFRQSVASCNKALTTMRSELKLVEAQTAGQANTLETLRSKHDVLSRTLDTAAEKEEAVRRGLEHAEEQYNKTGEELESYRRYLELAQASLKELEESSDATDESLEKQRQIVSDLSGVVSKGEETYQKAGDRVNDWRKQLNNAEAQVIRATQALNENDALMKEAEDSYDHCAKSIDAFGNEVDDTAEKLTSFGSTLKVRVNDALIDFGKNAVTSAVQGATELQDAENKLAASTGASADEMEKYSDTMQNIYNSGMGDSVAEIADGMAMVKQYTGEVDPTKLQELTENAMALDDTFSNMDMGETLRGVDSLMQNLGLDAEAAFDYIVVGAQNGLNKSGELTDNIAEYGQLWGQAGFSAQEMFTILQNGLDAGAYNLDKVNDFVKEFGISLSDGRIEENLSSFSTETQNLFLAWQNGEASTKDVFYSVINDLANMKNQQEALTIASNTWSALGEDNAMAVITSLTQVNNTYANVRGSMESLKEVRYDSVTNEYKKLGRTMQSEVITPVLQKFLPVAQKGMKLLADNIDTIVPIAGAAGAAMATIWVSKKATTTIANLKDTAKNIKTLVTNLVTHTTATAADTAATAADTVAKGAQATATGAATVAQEGLNTAMAANPVGLLVTGIAALVAGITTFVALSGDATDSTSVLRSEVKAMKEDLQESQEALESSMQSAKDTVDSAAANAQMADGIAEELMNLASATDNTAGKQERMAVLVAELNQLYPDMGLEIDSVTGKLNMTNEELQNYVDNLQDAAMAQAYQDAFAESFDAVTAAQKELIDSEMTLEEATANREAAQRNLEAVEYEMQQRQEKLRDLEDGLSEKLADGTLTMDEYNRQVADLTSNVITWNGTSENAQDLMQRLTDQVNEAKDIEDEAKEAVSEHTEAVEEATGVAENYQERYMEMNGTVNENTAAIQGNTGAMQEQQEAAQASISVAGQELEAFQGLSEEQQNLAVNVTNAVLEMQGTVQEYLGQSGQMFQEFADVSAVSTGDLLANMQSQVDGVRQWEENITALMDTTKTYIDSTGQEVQVSLDTGIVQYLMNMGPEGAAYAQTFVNMTGEEMAKANEIWSEKIDLENFTNTEGQSLTQGIGELAAGGEEAFANLAESLGAQAENSGRYVVQGLVDGMVAAQGDAETAGEDLGVKTTDGLDTGLGVASPSWKAKVSGLYVGVGLANGLRDGHTSAEIAAGHVGYLVITAIQQKLNSDTIQNIGYSVSTGLALGIRSGESEVIRAAQEVAQSAITAANNKLEINSPSHVFERIGAGTIEGYVKGVDENARAARKSVVNALDMKLASRDIQIQANAAGTLIDYNLLAATMVTALKRAGLTIKYNGREFGRVLSDMGVAFNNG